VSEEIRYIDRQTIAIYRNDEEAKIRFTEPALKQLGCRLQNLVSGINDSKELELTLNVLKKSGEYDVIQTEGLCVVHYNPKNQGETEDVLDTSDRESIDALCERMDEVEEMPELNPIEAEMEKGCPRRRRSTTAIDLKPILTITPGPEIDDKIDEQSENYDY